MNSSNVRDEHAKKAFNEYIQSWEVQKRRERNHRSEEEIQYHKDQMKDEQKTAEKENNEALDELIAELSKNLNL